MKPIHEPLKSVYQEIREYLEEEENADENPESTQISRTITEEPENVTVSKSRKVISTRKLLQADLPSRIAPLKLHF